MAARGIAIIGHGAIARHVAAGLAARGRPAQLVITRPGREGAAQAALDLPALAWEDGATVPLDGIGVALDCAGHGALRAMGPALLARGIDVITLSLGALADDAMAACLAEAAAAGGARLRLVSGAIGALDALSGAATGDLGLVRYTGRKPRGAWRGSAAEALVDLDALTEARTFFRGDARRAALEFPKNANVAAAVALAGVGFDATEVALVADPAARGNTHRIEAEGAFGRLEFTIEGKALPGQPGSSALAAMSMLAAALDHDAPVMLR